MLRGRGGGKHRARIGSIVGTAFLALLGWLPMAVAASWPYGAFAWAGEMTVQALDQAEYRVLLGEGDTTPGGGDLPVLNMGLPIVDAAGRVAFTGRLADGGVGEGFVWLDGSIVFRDSQAVGVSLVGAAPQLALGGDGQFLFRAQVEGRDVLWSDGGLVAKAGDPEPLLGGATVQILRRPLATDAGGLYWIAVYKGAEGAGRALFRRPPGGSPEVVLRSGDTVDGGVIAKPRGLDLSYDVSSDGAHHVHIVELENQSGGNGVVQAVLLDRQVVLRAGDPAGPGEVWDRFRAVAVDADGHWVVSGETSGPIETDTVFAYDGEIRLREGDQVGDISLRAQASIVAVDIDRGRIAQIWSTAGFGHQYVLFSCSEADIPQSRRLLGTRLAGERLGGEAVTAFEGTGHGSALRLGGGDYLYYWTELTRASGESRQAVIATRLPVCTPSGEGVPAVSLPDERRD
ncbi:MAG: hypothetical protein R2991_06415 [Thermoanaerobaculia bacterium]